MKKLLKKLGIILIGALLFVNGAACSEAKSTDSEVDKSKLYGVCYLAYEWETLSGSPTFYKSALQTMANLGVKSWRNWMHATWLLRSPTEIDENACSLMHDMLAEAEKHDIKVVGMSHNWFTGESNTMSIPYRDMSEGSYYVKWLKNYQDSWETLAREFPEVDTWEIGNELNNDDFIHPFYWESDGYVFSMAEKADIAADMLYYGSKGVKLGNPDAQTVMGGITSPGDFYSGKNEAFLERLYQNILSGEWPSVDPDDYFDIVSWHPYIEGVPDQRWLDCNNGLYEIVKKYEKKDKKVYITEMGWPDTITGDKAGWGGNAEQVAACVKELFRLAKEEMPYLETIHLFRLYNDVADKNYYNLNMSSYGLMRDPIYEDGCAKQLAYVYQELAGGQGELNLYVNDNILEW